MNGFDYKPRAGDKLEVRWTCACHMGLVDSIEVVGTPGQYRYVVTASTIPPGASKALKRHEVGSTLVLDKFSEIELKAADEHGDMDVI
jgi:hypothetical protein